MNANTKKLREHALFIYNIFCIVASVLLCFSRVSRDAYTTHSGGREEVIL